MSVVNISLTLGELYSLIDALESADFSDRASLLSTLEDVLDPYLHPALRVRSNPEVTPEPEPEPSGTEADVEDNDHDDDSGNSSDDDDDDDDASSTCTPEPEPETHENAADVDADSHCDCCAQNWSRCTCICHHCGHDYFACHYSCYPNPQPN
jgi:hypothetical protein